MNELSVGPIVSVRFEGLSPTRACCCDSEVRGYVVDAQAQERTKVRVMSDLLMPRRNSDQRQHLHQDVSVLEIILGVCRI